MTSTHLVMGFQKWKVFWKTICHNRKRINGVLPSCRIFLWSIKDEKYLQYFSQQAIGIFSGFNMYEWYLNTIFIIKEVLLLVSWQYFFLSFRFTDPWPVLVRFADRPQKLRPARRRKRRPDVPRDASSTTGGSSMSSLPSAGRRAPTPTLKIMWLILFFSAALNLSTSASRKTWKLLKVKN